MRVQPALYRAVAFVGALTLAACGAATTQPATTFEGQFDDLWATFDRRYSYFELKGVDWDAARARYRSQAAGAPTQDAFIAVIREMLGELRDVHVSLIAPSGAYSPTYTPTATANWDRNLWLGVVTAAGGVQYRTNLGYARIKGIPYIAVGAWNSTQFTTDDLDAVLENFRQDSTLIIDVRPNGGGNDQLALALASRFTTRAVVTEYFRYRNGASHSAFTSETARSVGPRGSWQFTKPVVVLSGRGVFSSNESFIAAMRELPNATVVGDTTGSGSGNPATYELGNGWKYTVSRWVAMTADRVPFEGRGIPPDVYARWNLAAVGAGRDPVLSAALQLLGAAPLR